MKHIEEYEDILEKRQEKLKEYEHYKYDLEEISLNLNKYKVQYYMWRKETAKSEDEYLYNQNIWLDDGNDYLDFVECIEQFSTSFLGPAYSFNRLTDSIIQDVFWDDNKFTIPKEEWISMGNRTNEIILDLHNCLISIKTALDRIIKLFRLYKNGIPEFCTFGHIDKNNKSKGFMSRIIQDKEKDDISKYVYQEYYKWIQECVRPRDIIIHYDDINVEYKFEKFCELPLFVYNKKEHVGNGSTVKKEEHIYKLSFLDVHSYVESFYSFANSIVEMIFVRLTSEGDVSDMD